MGWVFCWSIGSQLSFLFTEPNVVAWSSFSDRKLSQNWPVCDICMAKTSSGAVVVAICVCHIVPICYAHIFIAVMVQHIATNVYAKLRILQSICDRKTSVVRQLDHLAYLAIVWLAAISILFWQSLHRPLTKKQQHIIVHVILRISRPNYGRKSSVVRSLVHSWA